MTISKVRWNPFGTVLAIAGQQEDKETKSVLHIVQFYSAFGQHIRTMKVPGSGIKGISWEGTGLRLAVIVGSFIFFANVRPKYKYAYFNNTVMYAYTKIDRPEHSVVFWNPKTDEKSVKYVASLH